VAKPAISVVIVAYRQREALTEALRSVMDAAARVPGGAELIVVDNGALADHVRAVAPAALVIEPGENLGFAGGVQRGVERAQGEWVALVNDDARIEPDSLVRLLQAGAGDERLGTVAAQVRFESAPERINSAGIVVDTLGVASERLAGRPVSQAGKACEVFGASGCFVLYRRAMLQQTGGLEPRFFAYLEDVDLAWRARAAGWLARYEPRAVAYHRGSASSGSGSAGKYFLVGRNRVRLLARNATGARLARSLPGIVLYEVAYVLYAALTDRTLAPLRGRLQGLREFRAFRAETDGTRRDVTLAPAWRGWLESLRMSRAYRESAARSGGAGSGGTGAGGTGLGGTVSGGPGPAA
jgi:GT2 family glycosyltransferase